MPTQHAQYTESLDRFTLDIPAEAVADCSHSGPCDDDVAYWLPRVDFSAITRDALIAALREYGAWTREEFAEASDETLQSRMLWLACGELSDLETEAE